MSIEVTTIPKIDLDASAIISGRFSLDRLPSGELGSVITGQGINRDPIYQILVVAKLGIFPSDTLRNFNDSIRMTTSSSYTKLKETQILGDLKRCRIRFDLESTGGTVVRRAKIYRNGNPIGTERTLSGSTTTTFTEDFSNFHTNDFIQIYAMVDGGMTSLRVSNFRFYYDFMIETIGDGILASPLLVTNDPTVEMIHLL